MAGINKIKKQVPVHNIETKQMQGVGFDILNLEGKGGGKKYDSSQLHRHTFYELFFFTGGKGDHEIDFMHYPVEKNSIHFVSPGQIHKLTLKKTKGYVFCFTEDFISLRANENFTEKFPFYDAVNPPLVAMNRSLSDELEKLVVTINKEFRTPGTNSEMLRAYLEILLLKIKALYAPKYQKAEKPLPARNAKVTQFKELINSDYLLHQPVSDYSARLGVSPNHLNALCKLHEGKTAIQLLHERLLLEAKRLLYATNMNVKQISFELKFEDVAYFNRFFKKQTQLTPVRYRQLSQLHR